MTMRACPKCGAVFSEKQDLRDHWEDCPGGQGGSGDDPKPEYTCGTCGQVFSSDTALGSHSLSRNCRADV